MSATLLLLVHIAEDTGGRASPAPCQATSHEPVHPCHPRPSTSAALQTTAPPVGSHGRGRPAAISVNLATIKTIARRKEEESRKDQTKTNLYGTYYDMRALDTPACDIAVMWRVRKVRRGWFSHVQQRHLQKYEPRYMPPYHTYKLYEYIDNQATPGQPNLVHTNMGY